MANDKADKAAGAKAEAKLASITVKFEGTTYTIPRENVDDLELFEALEDNKYISATRGFLGQQQWDAFKDAHRVGGRVPMSTMNSFLDALMESLGNRSASSDS
jgi:hypothetical protein